jgi:hypothetical protein
MIDLNNIISWIQSYCYKYNIHNIILDCFRNCPESHLLLSLSTKIIKGNIVKIVNINNPIAKHYDFSVNNDFERIKVISELSNNHICLGNLSKLDMLYIRPYERHTLGADLSPFANFTYEEVDSAINIVRENYKLSAVSDFEITPSELMWIYKIDSIHNILSIDDISKYKLWYTFNLRQKLILSKLHQHVKLTDIKNNINVPIYKV